MGDISSEVTGMASEFGEVALDAALDEGLLRELPIIGTAVGVARIAQTLRDRIFMRDISRVISDARSVPPEKRQRFLELLAADGAAKARLQDCVLRSVAQADDAMKVDVFSKLFRALLVGVLSQESFLRLSLAIRQVYAPDLLELKASGVESSESAAFQNCVAARLTYFHDIDGSKPQNHHVFIPRWHLTALGKDFIRALSYEPNQSPEPTS